MTPQDRFSDGVAVALFLVVVVGFWVVVLGVPFFLLD
jgi:hypothetical protein